jgi:FlaA1/EpsC-like NDP-sugar epimerase
MYVQSLSGKSSRKSMYVNISASVDQRNSLLPEHLESETKFITTRFGNVLGSNGSVIPRFKQQIQAGGPITVTHPEITRYFMTIPEAVQLVLEAGNIGKGSEIFIFDMGKPVKIVDLANKMIRLAGLTPDEDIKIFFTGLRPGEKLYEELLNKEEETMPTHHEKIKIARVIPNPPSIRKEIDGLIQLAEMEDNYKVVAKMKNLLPEFKSNNSIYENLDKVIPQREAILSKINN